MCLRGDSGVVAQREKREVELMKRGDRATDAGRQWRVETREVIDDGGWEDLSGRVRDSDGMGLQTDAENDQQPLSMDVCYLKSRQSIG
jgi:hypothetical protein